MSDEEVSLAQEELMASLREEEAAKQEAYYWHCISEFYGMLKFFGTKKVMGDLNTFKSNVELPKEEPRIIRV